jgi:hypothetical protein
VPVIGASDVEKVVEIDSSKPERLCSADRSRPFRGLITVMGELQRGEKQ